MGSSSGDDSVILKPKIMVFGVGGAGGNAVNNMIASDLTGAEFVVANTDAQALERSKASVRIQLGVTCTRGLGAGSYPEVGEAAALESEAEIRRHLEGVNMLFITAGMGGGTGTGASPVIARIAMEMDILTVGVVTKPFAFEGDKRARVAESGLSKLEKYVDTLIIIPNQNLFHVANGQTSLIDAFKMADEVLRSGVRSVVDLILMPGLINLDFADIQSVMKEKGRAVMGGGESEGENRAVLATECAIASPLLDLPNMSGAKGVLINITGGKDMALYEVDAAANLVRQKVDSDANIIVGSTFDESLSGKIRVAVVATGIGGGSNFDELSKFGVAGVGSESVASSGVNTSGLGIAKTNSSASVSGKRIFEVHSEDEVPKFNEYADLEKIGSLPIENEEEIYAENSDNVRISNNVTEVKNTLEKRVQADNMHLKNVNSRNVTSSDKYDANSNKPSFFKRILGSIISADEGAHANPNTAKHQDMKEVSIYNDAERNNVHPNKKGSSNKVKDVPIFSEHD